MLDVSIIIVNWNTARLLAECLESIRETVLDATYEVWVVDNASQDESVAMLESRFPWVNLILNTSNVGFARANNQAIALSNARYVLLLNSDAKLLPGAVNSLINLAETHNRAAIVGAQLFNPDGSFQASYTSFPSLKQELLILSGLGRLSFGPWYPSRGPGQVKEPCVADYVEGACLLVRREAIAQVGGLDEGYFMYSEEIDWCKAMKKAGWQVWFQPEAHVVHHGGASSRNHRTLQEAALYRSRVRFFRKYYGNGHAVALKTLIFIVTTCKIGVHGCIRLATRGRRGRQVIGLKSLARFLSSV